MRQVKMSKSSGIILHLKMKHLDILALNIITKTKTKQASLFRPTFQEMQFILRHQKNMCLQM